MRKRLLITGATGHLGGYLMRESDSAEFDVIDWGGPRTKAAVSAKAKSVDLTDPVAVAAAFKDARPDVVIHAAAMANAEGCAKDSLRAVEVNACGTATLARLSREDGVRLVYVSTDLVFDGERGRYIETDHAAPTSVYGQSKVTGEWAILGTDRNAVVRVSWMFGPPLNGGKNFFDQQVEAIRGHGPPKDLFCDEWRTPLSLLTAARALIEIAMSDVGGILHVGGPDRMSRWEVGVRLAAHLKCGTTGIRSVSRPIRGEPRPRDVSLDSGRWRALFPQVPWPAFERALAEMGVGS
jgi:dTDP-4-dehydrorhamnose reductase